MPGANLSSHAEASAQNWRYDEQSCGKPIAHALEVLV